MRKDGAKNNRTKRALFTLDQEIFALKAIRKNLKSSFSLAVKILENRKGKIVTCGVGKSAFVAMKLTATANSLNHLSTFVHPTEALHGDVGVVKNGDVVVAVSFSGESIELIKFLKHLKSNFRIKIIGITKNKSTSLGIMCDSIIPVEINEEGCPLSLAPMASIVASLAIADMLVSAITFPSTNSEITFAKFHPGGSIGLRLAKVKNSMEAKNNPPIVFQHEPLRRAIEEITKYGRGIAGVINKKGDLVGVITDGDIRRFFLKNTSIDGAKSTHAMTKAPKVIFGNDNLQTALETMEEFSITNLFVIDRTRKPIGIIHIHNILDNKKNDRN